MKKSSIIWLVVVVIVVVVVGYVWWASSMSSYGSPAATTQTPTPTAATTPTTPQSPTSNGAPAQPASAAVLTLNKSGSGTFGEYLSASNGMTLYQYTKDATNVSNCTGGCATAWPPYTVSAAEALSLTADPGIAGQIGTITRADGSLQVTYRGLPLYFFAGDAKPGDVKGEAVNGFTEVAP
jgi:predicted lipoprotein with Yx(FWY)xxD motif